MAAISVQLKYLPIQLKYLHIQKNHRQSFDCALHCGCHQSFAHILLKSLIAIILSLKQMMLVINFYKALSIRCFSTFLPCCVKLRCTTMSFWTVSQVGFIAMRLGEEPPLVRTIYKVKILACWPCILPTSHLKGPQNSIPHSHWL